MNEQHSSQLHLDFRTGRPTTISGPGVGEAERAACVALNRQRARGITEAARLAPPRESVSFDVWSAIFTRRATEWGVPLIPLQALGIAHDSDRLITSKFLTPLKSGAEACPFHDEDWGVVYKLFPLLSSGGLGKKIVLEWDDNEDSKPDVSTLDAVLFETVEKLTMLHEVGAHHTEIVGLATTGDYLIAKQPLAYPTATYENDRQTALDLIHAITPRAPLRRSLSVVWVNHEAWFVCDLHVGNIMRDANNKPTIIDALVGAVTPNAVRRFGWLADAVNDARCLRSGAPFPQRRAFDDVDDATL